MLFNSYIFVFAFLPLTYVVFRLAIGAGAGWQVSIGVLALASLVFYGWASLEFLSIFMVSMAINGAVVFALGHSGGRTKWWLAAFGVLFDLCFIGWFKYYDFFLAQITSADHQSGFSLAAVALPIGISFYTFQQIAYIVDAYKGDVGAYNPLKHLLFISFFPQLIAGPIVHHREMMPQFENPQTDKLTANLAIGFSIFAIGLFKKVIIADGIAPTADIAFNAAAVGEAVTFMSAWVSATAFSFQLYFDFSGYSDMAVGLARMFGIVLPLNFNSPYKSANIIEFWRRWHMTLSRFLRDYLYIPLGGNRKGPTRRYTNLLTVMLLAGLWHGAGWTFVLWGGLHGVMLAGNHLWRIALRRLNRSRKTPIALSQPVFILLTFVLVTIAWVPFRAPSMEVAINLLQIMGGSQGDILGSVSDSLLRLRQAVLGVIDLFVVIAGDTRAPVARFEQSLAGDWSLLLLYICAFITFFLPNTAQLFAAQRPVLETQALDPTEVAWRPTAIWAIAIAALFIAAVLDFTSVSPFLYFQF